MVVPASLVERGFCGKSWHTHFIQLLLSQVLFFGTVAKKTASSLPLQNIESHGVSVTIANVPTLHIPVLLSQVEHHL
jgi:hypothetical protein